jgi:hypothetical protein
MASIDWWGARRRRVAPAILGLGIVVSVIAACSSQPASRVRAALGAGTNAPAGKVAAGAADLAPFSPSTASGSSGGGSVESQPQAQLVTDQRALIRTAQLTVRVKKSADVAKTADTAEALVIKRGGVVFADNRSSGPDAQATLTLKVPPALLTSILSDLSKLGVEQSRTVATEDVTTAVADVQARLKSATDSINRLNGLFAKATKVGDIIAIENELATREADRESLQAQQKALSSETSTATITLSLVPAMHAVVVVHHHRNSVINALSKGWHHFTSSAVWVLGALATLVPFLLLVVLGFSLWVGLGRLRQQRQPRTDRSPAAS